MAQLNEIGKKWVEALRSGKYIQGQGCLRDGDAFCCLGVLCDLAAKEGIGEWMSDGGFSQSYGHAPHIVRQWSGLKNGSGDFGQEHHLTGLNDTGSTFEEIAATIEKHAEELGLAER